MSHTNNESKLAEHAFKLSYDGDLTKNHTMNAEALGQSIISMAALITQADKLLNGEQSEAKIDVKAPNAGSYEIEFVAWLSSGGIDILKTLGVSAMSATAFSASLLSILKQLRNRKIANIVINKDEPEKSYVQLEDNEQVPCTPEIAKLVQSHVVRTQVDNIFRKPVLKDPTAKVKLGLSLDNEDMTQVITYEDTTLLKAPPKKSLQEETITTEIKNVFFVQINLESSKGWKAKIQGNKEFSVKMDDKAFIDRVNLKKDFPVKGELFEVELEITVAHTDNKESTSYRITEVRRHRTTDEGKKIL